MQFSRSQQTPYPAMHLGFLKGKRHKLEAFVFILSVVFVLAGFCLFSFAYLGDNVYWEMLHKRPVSYQDVSIEGFRIVNASWKEIKSLEFSFKLYAPHDNIVVSNSIEELNVLNSESLDSTVITDAVIIVESEAASVDVIALGKCNEASRNLVQVVFEQFPRSSSFDIQLFRHGSTAPLSTDDVALRTNGKRLSEKGGRPIFLEQPTLCWLIIGLCSVQLVFLLIKRHEMRKAFRRERGYLIGKIYNLSVKSAKEEADSLLEPLPHRKES